MIQFFLPCSLTSQWKILLDSVEPEHKVTLEIVMDSYRVAEGASVWDLEGSRRGPWELVTIVRVVGEGKPY